MVVLVMWAATTAAVWAAEPGAAGVGVFGLAAVAGFADSGAC